nr:hypothetical protein Iba_chr03cCG6930 [Ipomoea batatas]
MGRPFTCSAIVEGLRARRVFTELPPPLPCTGQAFPYATFYAGSRARREKSGEEDWPLPLTAWRTTSLVLAGLPLLPPLPRGEGKKRNAAAGVLSFPPPASREASSAVHHLDLAAAATLAHLAEMGRPFTCSAIVEGLRAQRVFTELPPPLPCTGQAFPYATFYAGSRARREKSGEEDWPLPPTAWRTTSLVLAGLPLLPPLPRGEGKKRNAAAGVLSFPPPASREASSAVHHRDLSSVAVDLDFHNLAFNYLCLLFDSNSNCLPKCLHCKNRLRLAKLKLRERLKSTNSASIVKGSASIHSGLEPLFSSSGNF